MKTDAASFGNMLNLFVNGTLARDDAVAFKTLERNINDFSKKRESWEGLIGIILNQQNNNVLVLASNLLKDKIQFDFGQLDSEGFKHLHSSLVTVISKHITPSNTLRANLSLCIALVYMHKAKEIGQLLPYLVNCFKDGNKNYIFTVLSMLPNEISNSKIVIDENKRIEVHAYLRQIQRVILVELNNTGKEVWKDMSIKRTTLLKCFCSWINLTYDKQVMASLPEHFLMQAAFANIKDQSLSDESNDCIYDVLNTSQGPSADPELYTYLAGKIFDFFPLVYQSVKQRDYECEMYINVLCKFGRKSVSEFAKSPNQSCLDFLDKLTQLTSVSQLDCSQHFIKFWRKFLFQIMEVKTCHSTYRPQMMKLYISLCKLIRLTVNECNQLNVVSSKDLENKSQQFQNKVKDRNGCAELFNLIAEVVQSDQCLALSFQQIGKISPDSPSIWTQFQSFVFPLEYVFEGVTKPTQRLNDLINKVISVKPPYITVYKTFIDFLSSCSPIYTRDADMTAKCFQYLADKLNHQELINAAARAFQNVCHHNPQFVRCNIESFMQILNSYKDKETILVGVVRAITSSQEYLNVYLPLILGMYTKEFEESKSKADMKNSLMKITLIVDQISKKQQMESASFLLSFFTQIWAYIKPSILNPGNDKESLAYIEKCCKFIKCNIRALKGSFSPYINEVYSTILESYDKNPIDSFVYLIEVLVTVFNNQEEYKTLLSSVFAKTCEITFSHLSRLQKIEENSGLAQDFFGMLTRFLKYAPAIIFEYDNFGRLLDLMLIVCGVESDGIAKSFYRFIETLYMLIWSQALLDKVAENKDLNDRILYKRTPETIQLAEKAKAKLSNTPNVLLKIIQHLQTSPSSTVRDYIYKALLSQIKAFPAENQTIWTPCLNYLDEDILTPTQKNQFLSRLPIMTDQSLGEIETTLDLMCKRFVHRQLRSAVMR